MPYPEAAVARHLHQLIEKVAFSGPVLADGCHHGNGSGQRSKPLQRVVLQGKPMALCVWQQQGARSPVGHWHRR